ncbi:MAG: hypothetical protein BEN18_01810 [Epulopiscium sp. Nuni2H_MBin001]|nr:MAG: hypothetical protein BEN18_01810 [Epulopiscium sp. Nuni2H_MBin001]
MRGISNQILSSNNTLQQAPIATGQKDIARQLLAQNVKNGVIEGSLNNENGKTLLELANGSKMEVKLAGELPMGKFMAFNVSTSQDGDIILRPHNGNNQPNATAEHNTQQLTEQVIGRLNLPNSEEMRACVEGFMSRSMTLDKQELLKANFTVQKFDLPVEVVTNLLEKATTLTPEELEIAQQLKNEGVTVMSDKLIDISANQLNDEGKQQMLEFINTKTTQENSQSQPQSQPQTQSQALPEQSQLNIENQANKTPIINIEEVITKELTKLLLGEEIQNLNPKEAIENMLGNFKEVAQTLEEIVEKDESLKNSPVKQDVETAKQTVEVASKLQEDGGFNMLSPLMHHQLENGSVHFFEPKNGGGGRGSTGLYIVIALDLEALSHVQLHIHKVDKDLNIQMYVEDEKIKSYLSAHASGLMKVAYEAGYNISQISIDAINKEEIPKVSIPVNTTHNFDFRV